MTLVKVDFILVKVDFILVNPQFLGFFLPINVNCNLFFLCYSVKIHNLDMSKIVVSHYIVKIQVLDVSKIEISYPLYIIKIGEVSVEFLSCVWVG